MYCRNCGSEISNQAMTCPKCGGPTGVIDASPKKKSTATLLCLFLGMLGVHRFYVGKIGTGIVQLVTGGGFGIWLLIDLINLICGRFRDANDKLLVDCPNIISN